MISQIKKYNQILNRRFDLWSFTYDFLFLLGTFLFDWNPILLVVWFMIDTCTMLILGIHIFYKENKSYFDAFLYICFIFFFLGIMYALFLGIKKFVFDLEMEDEVNTDLTQIINPIFLPIILVCSLLSHVEEYHRELERFEKGTYNGQYFKHFGKRYVAINVICFLIALSYVYFEASIIVGLILIRSFLRVYKEKYRDIL